MNDTTAANRDFLGHPRGLVICFGTEMWERRFSFYGMKYLLLYRPVPPVHRCSGARRAG